MTRIEAESGGRLLELVSPLCHCQLLAPGKFISLCSTKPEEGEECRLCMKVKSGSLKALEEQNNRAVQEKLKAARLRDPHQDQKML